MAGNFGAGGAVNLESISIATYVCDFGNVVVGSTKRKSFRLTNVGRIPVTFNFDKKLLTLLLQCPKWSWLQGARSVANFVLSQDSILMLRVICISMSCASITTKLSRCSKEASTGQR